MKLESSSRSWQIFYHLILHSKLQLVLSNFKYKLSYFKLPNLKVSNSAFSSNCPVQLNVSRFLAKLMLKMLETKYFGDKFLMLVTDLIIFVTSNHFGAEIRNLNLSPILFVAYMRNQHQYSLWIIRQSVRLLIAIVLVSFDKANFKKWDACSWKGQLENEKLEIFKLESSK